MNILTTTLHRIDITTNKHEYRDLTNTDATQYITDLTNNLLNSIDKREFVPKNIDTNFICSYLQNNFYQSEIAATLDSTINENSSALNFKSIFLTFANNMATNLLNSQLNAQQKYSTITKIKSGSLVQSFIEYNASFIILIALIENSEFIDDADLLKKIGLPTNNATYKSAIFSFNKDLTLSNIFLTDTNKVFTNYWYDDFLDLTEKTNDITNTTTAYRNINRALSTSLSSKHKKDYILLKNSLDSYFIQKEIFSLNDCTSFLFDEYIPSDDIDLNDLKEKINERARILKFDTNFKIDMCNISLKNNRFKLTDNLELKMFSHKDNFKDYFYADIYNDEKVLIIRNISDDIFDKFN